MATTHTDGGYYALVGFLYQFVGSFRYYVTLQADTGKQGEDQDVIFLLEAFDEDVVVIQKEKPNRAKYTLVQFKYSESKRDIAPAMLKKICDGFEKAQKKAQEQADPAEDIQMEFRLITNQTFSRESQKIWEDSRSSPVKIQSKYGNSRVNSEDKATLTAILPSMQYEMRDKEADIVLLQNYMLQFGVLKREMQKQINNVTGHYFSGTTGKKSIVSRDDFHEQLIGFSGAHQLRSSEAMQKMERQLTIVKSTFAAPKSIRRRGVEQAIRDAVDAHKALIVLSGDGGNGKSMTLCRIIESALPFTNEHVQQSPLGQLPFGFICHAGNYKSCLLSQRVEDWRGRRTSSDKETFPTAIERLESTKEKTEDTILVVGIDGLDEICGESRSAIDEIIDWMKQEEEDCYEQLRRPRAILVATCREADQIVNPYYRAYGYFKEKSKDDSISVGVFSHQEFALAMRDLAEQSISGKRVVYARLFKAAMDRIRREEQDSIDLMRSGSTSPAFGRSPSAITIDQTASSLLYNDDSLELSTFLKTLEGKNILSLSKSSSAISEEIYDSLLHPAFWRCFDGLKGPEHYEDGQSQQSLLDGDPEPLSDLVGVLINWFKVKCESRRQIPIEHTEMVLKTAAKTTKDSNLKVASRAKHWEQPAAQREIGIPIPTSLIIFREALCSGLIESQGEAEWRWRHSFLQEVLAQ